jgi:transposase
MTVEPRSPVCPEPAAVPLPPAPSHPPSAAPPLPDGPCPVCPRLAVEFEPWRQARYWKAMHDRAVQHEALLKQEIEQLRAQLRVREQQLFGRKTEAGATAALTPPAPRVIPKSSLGVSVWVTVMLDKYLSYRPTYRLLADLRTHGLDLALGTVTDGLQRLVPLFEPLYQALAAHSRRQPLWHGDETRWLVFATVEGTSASAGTCGSSTPPRSSSSSWPRAGPTRCRRSTWARRRPGSWSWTATRRTRRWPRSSRG